MEGKLRVKMHSPGYLVGSNCQFPRDLRVEGRFFKVSSQYVKLITTRGKYVYSIKNREAIEIISSPDTSIDIKAIKVFEDTSTKDCAICLSLEKTIVFIPCGHCYTCTACSARVTACPICRAHISDRVNKNLLTKPFAVRTYQVMFCGCTHKNA